MQLDPFSVEVKLGTKPALRFDELEPSELAWLLSLVGPPLKKEVPPPPTHKYLVAQLKRGGFVSVKAKTAVPREPLNLMATEAVCLTSRNLDGHAIIANRTASIVGVQGISRTTFHALVALAAGGVRYFVINDSRRLDRIEFAHEGLDLATSPTRAVAVRDFFARTMPQCIVLSQHTAVDAVIVNFEEVVNPLEAAGLHAQGIAHLVTTSLAQHIEVGPFVIPGQTGCCNCVLLSRTTDDQRRDFAQFSAQITRAAAQGLAFPAAQSAAAARVAGGIIAGQVLMYLDGLIPHLTGTLQIIDNVGPVPRSVPWQPHQECMCLPESEAHANLQGPSDGDAAPADTAGAA